MRSPIYDIRHPDYRDCPVLLRTTMEEDATLFIQLCCTGCKPRPRPGGNGKCHSEEQ